jgi:predicted lipid-binding transport protein (Tim44 family)
VVTPVRGPSPFYAAEAYHQDYARRNPDAYGRYRRGCGKDARLRQIWGAFNRNNPIEAAAREKAWTGTAHGLIAELGVGTATATALQLGLGIAGLFAGIGLFALLAGFGLVWVARAATEDERAPKVVLQRRAMPA